MEKKFYSQNDEQEYIEYYFSNYDNGYFLEIGAFDPKVFSNTRILVEKGWNGVYVEPSPSCAEKFRIEYENNPKIELIEAAIGNFDGLGNFYDSQGDAISSTDLSHKIRWEQGNNVVYKELEVKFISVETLLKNIKEVDFLNLDVESTNIEIFNLIPDYFWRRLKMLCIEHDNQYNYIEEKLKIFGFKNILFNGENLILAK
jgi:FkbM family methyltransferase